MLTLEQRVAGLERALGDWFYGSRPLTAATGEVASYGLAFSGAIHAGQAPVFHQVLESGVFYVGFEPGSETYQVLSNDQNRFSLPRSLPPLLALQLPEDEDNGQTGFVATRHAYSEGAFTLLHDLLESSYVFSLKEFLAFAAGLGQALAFLHENGVVHGQWNPRSCVGIPTDEKTNPFSEHSIYRFEIVNTGVCFRDSADIPKEYLDRGYYPAEIYLASSGGPDYGAIDIPTDVYCFAAFLKDILNRACSSEDLTTQANRIHEHFQKEVSRRGLKATPERLRQKEQEILDHLYTIKARTEMLIQEGLKDRERRLSGQEMYRLADDLHQKACEYADKLFEMGFESINVFGDELQHYTAFTLAIEPNRINSFEDSEVVLSGGGLPHELVRITLNDRDRGIHVLSAQPGKIHFQVSRGFPAGSYKLSINNRRTNGRIEVCAPTFRSIEPRTVHQPWEGFGNLKIHFKGDDLPRDVYYSFREVVEGGSEESQLSEDEVRVLSARPIEIHPPPAEGDEGKANPASPEHAVELELPEDVQPGIYELCANGMRTGLQLDVLESLPDPQIHAEGFDPGLIKNHRSHAVAVEGHNFHPDMVLDLGPDTPDEFRFVVEDGLRATISLPAGFRAGKYPVRLNHKETGHDLVVVAPTWTHVQPPTVKFKRGQKDPVSVTIAGAALPQPDGERAVYSLRGSRGTAVKDAVTKVRVEKEETTHRLNLAANLPRGRNRLFFGDFDTGLRVRVKRQLPRSAVAGITLACLALLTLIGMQQKAHWAPRIAAVQPDTVFDYKRPELEIDGQYLAAVELIGADGVPLEFPLTREDSSEPYRLSVEDLKEGSYQLRPIGPLYSSDPSEGVTLTVLSAGLAVEPDSLHRMESVTLKVTAVPEFDLQGRGLSELQLLRDGMTDPIAFSITADGYVDVPRGSFAGSAVGSYALAIDGQPLSVLDSESGSRAPATLTVVGPEVTAVQPDHVTLDETGQIAIQLEAAYMKPELWIGLVPQDGDTVAFELRLEGENDYVGTVEPGLYRIALGRGDPAIGDGELEWVEGIQLQVDPRPLVTGLSPQKLEPGEASTIFFEGINLPATEFIVLRPTAPGVPEIQIPMDPARVVLEEGLRGVFRAENVVVSSGSYEVHPSEVKLVVEAFDDCRKMLEAFAADGGDATELVQCLVEERPPEDVILRAAQLLFDRGHFTEARLIYDSRPETASRFRVALISSFVDGQDVGFRTDAADVANDPYLIAATRLGWIEGESPSFGGGVALPWELEFVRGVTADDPARAVEALIQSRETKTAACEGKEVQPFGPTDEALALAYLDLAEQRIARAQGLQALEILQAELIGKPDVFARLTAADRGRAQLWLGHLQLWYLGEEDQARQTLQAIAGSPAAPDPDAEPVEVAIDANVASLYLTALDAGTLPAAGGAGGGENGDWVSSFLRVFRFYREISKDPNYNLLTERYDFDVYLEADERKKSIEFHRSLRALEAFTEPADPLAHYALLYYLRNAQSVAWPLQEGGRKAQEFRNRLVALQGDETFGALRQFYVCLGAIGPLDGAQISVLQASEKKSLLEQVQKIGVVPSAFKEESETLKKKLLTTARIGSGG